VSYATALYAQPPHRAWEHFEQVPALSEPKPTPSPTPSDTALDAVMDRLAQSGPVKPTPTPVLRLAMAAPPPVASNMCAVVATEIYNRVKDSYWREIIWIKGASSDGKKLVHEACVWIPMKGANVHMYDERFATIELRTKDTSKEAILTALRLTFPKMTFNEIHFLDEKTIGGELAGKTAER
jgi:hypothetical protein